MSSTSKSECLLRRDARLYCQKRNQRILWQTWRDERRSNDSLDRELKYLERSRSLKSRAMDREQGRFLESLVDIFQRQCDIASDRLERNQSLKNETQTSVDSELKNNNVPTYLTYEKNCVLPAIEENVEVTSLEKTPNIDNLSSRLGNEATTSSKAIMPDESGVKLQSVEITPCKDETYSVANRSAFTHTAPPLRRAPNYSGHYDRKLVSADGVTVPQNRFDILSVHREAKSAGIDKKMTSEPRPRTFYSLKRMANLSRQRNREVENFRRQFLVNALAKQLHISAMRSQNFAENDDIRKKIERKKRCLSELKRDKHEFRSTDSRNNHF